MHVTLQLAMRDHFDAPLVGLANILTPDLPR